MVRKGGSGGEKGRGGGDVGGWPFANPQTALKNCTRLQPAEKYAVVADDARKYGGNR